MIKKLFIDTETRSPVNLFTAGTKRYATEVEVIIVTWFYAGFDKAPRCWDVTSGKPMPADLARAAVESDEIYAFNSFFDRTVLGMMPWWKRLEVPLTKWRCVMAQALAHGLPGGLDKLCEIFQVEESNRKLPGKDFIDMFCKPLKDGTFNDSRSHPEEWQGFLKYAIGDIPAMMRVHKMCPQWNMKETEVGLWHLDQTINDRGFAVDVEMCDAMVRATTAEKKRLADRTEEITEGVVERTTQRDMLLGYLLLEYGVELPNLKADTVERRLEDPELPEFVKELLRIRLQASKASTAKYKRAMQCEVGGRIYGGLQYCAANRTRRWGGRLIQPQNFQRPSHKFVEILPFIEAVKAGVEDVIYDEIMAYAASSLRSMIVAAPGHKLCVSDLSNIEGRMTAWLAQETWKLAAFAAYDRKEGPDLYKVAYARSFGVDPESVEDDSDERQIGKVQELALGYQGGVNAYVTMAATYGVDLELMAERAYDSIPRVTLRDSYGVLAWAKQNQRTLGLSDKVYVVCEALKQLWRNAHPETETMWGAYEAAARNAILNPDIEFTVGAVTFDRVKNWMRIRLPSGGYLCYPKPKVEGNKISYMGVNVYNKRWHRISTYGGKIVENIVQAASRDIIADAMPRAEAEGYKIVLTCHDEIMSEVPDEEQFTDRGLSAILAANPDWAPGLPLAAKGFTTDRYKKS